jgi:DNA-binding XRE family transcriptional regulator
MLTFICREQLSGRKLAALRNRADMSIRDLAYMLDLSPATIARAEQSAIVRTTIALSALYVFHQQSSRLQQVAAAQEISIPPHLPGPAKRPRGRPRKRRAKPTPPAGKATKREDQQREAKEGENDAS